MNWNQLAFLLMLAAFPLLTIGANAESPAVWGLGFAALAAGSLIPPVRRFIPERESEQTK